MTTPSPVELSANGWRFDALSWGDPASETVLALHGFPQRATSWSAVADRLASAGLRVLAPNQRGYSAGARPTEVAAYRLRAVVGDAVALIDAIGGPVHLVGHDWGGMVGWQVAARYPDRLRSFTAVSTPHPLALAEALGEPAQRRRFDYIRLFRQEGKAERVLLADGAARLRALYGEAVAAESVTADVEFFAQPAVLTAALNWYRAMSPSTDNDGLGAVRVPTAYVWGSEDIAFGPVPARGTEAWVTAAYRFVALPGVGHWVPEQAPQAVADAVLGHRDGS